MLYLKAKALGAGKRAGRGVLYDRLYCVTGIKGIFDG